jgi:recombination protein RecR
MIQNEQYPSKILEKAVSEIAKLPGIGRRTALRLSLHLLKQDLSSVKALSASLIQLKQDIKHCQCCYNLSDTDICDICANPLRDKSKICVVENIRGVMSIENTGQYRGLYHVLGGTISPMDGIGPSDLHLEPLINRVKSDEIQEVILALNPTMEGDTTNFYISKRLSGCKIKISVLARGVSIGDELEYTDEITLGRSIVNRTELII